MRRTMKFLNKAMYVVGVFSLVAFTALSAGTTPALASGSAIGNAAGEDNCTVEEDFLNETITCTWHKITDNVCEQENTQSTGLLTLTSPPGPPSESGWQPGPCPPIVPGISAVEGSLTDPADAVCEQVTFTLLNNGNVEFTQVGYAVLHLDNNLIIVDLTLLGSLAPNSVFEITLPNVEPNTAYALLALGWTDGDPSVDDPVASAQEISEVVEPCPQEDGPGDDPEGSLTGSPVSGVLIPVTGFDAAGQAAFLASMAANLGFGSLGAGLLLHGLNLRRKNSKKDK